jgi:hypothetical protein
MDRPILLRAPLACRLASVDKNRFNEAVARGDYPCAPQTEPGMTREFTIADTIALFCWGQMTNITISPKQAGHFACEILNLAKRVELGHAPAHAWAAIINAGGMIEYACSDPSEPEIEKRKAAGTVSPAPVSYGEMDVIWSWNFSIATIRRCILNGIEDFRRRLGEEEAIG